MLASWLGNWNYNLEVDLNHNCISLENYMLYYKLLAIYQVYSEFLLLLNEGDNLNWIAKN